MKSFVEMQAEIHEVNRKNGWFESERPFSTDIALLVTEVGEAYDAYRRWGMDDATEPKTDNPKPEGVGSELADILIRLLDTTERTGTDLLWEYERKLAYNATRGYRHGGKLA